MGGIRYWGLATDFLGLVEAACGELVKHENAWVVVDDKATIEEREGLIRWSDHSIGVPLLFNFFHGIELILKGFVGLQGKVPHHHKLTGLLADLDAAYPGTELGGMVARYTSDLSPVSPLGRFFATNGLTVDDWYEALKYPESKGGQRHDHVDLKYGGRNTLIFWETLGSAAAEIRVAAVKLAHELGHY